MSLGGVIGTAIGAPLGLWIGWNLDVWYARLRARLRAPRSRILIHAVNPVAAPEEGEAGYRCPNCGEPYDSKCRTPADRVCFQCRHPEE